MYRTTINFHNRIQRGEKPIIYCMIHTDYGYRVYAEKELSDIFEVAGLLADGSVTADGSHTAGEGLGLLDKAGRVLSFGPFERTIQPRKKDVLASYSTKQLQHASIALDNADHYFSRLIPREPFLTKSLDIYCGFEADPFSERLRLFSGVISEVGLKKDGLQLVLEADEK